MAKKNTVPLWAQKNVKIRVQPRKADSVPLWARGKVAAMAQQAPLDPAGLALHKFKESQTALREEREGDPPTEPINARPVKEPAPHPFLHLSKEEAEARRQEGYQRFWREQARKKAETQQAALTRGEDETSHQPGED